MNPDSSVSPLLSIYHKPDVNEDIAHQPLSPAPAVPKPPRSYLLEILKKIHFPYIELLLRKSPFCRHDYGCLENILSGTCNSLLLSYILNVGINFLSLVPFKRRYSEFIWSLIHLNSLRMCAFITSYTFVLKVAICFLRYLRQKDDQINNFFSGACAGFVAIGFLEKTSRMTWSGYLLARAFDAFYKHLVNKKVFKKREIHYIFIFALMYGFYGYCIALENEAIPQSISKFFNSVYKATYEKNRFTLNSVLADRHAHELAKKYGR